MLSPSFITVISIERVIVVFIYMMSVALPPLTAVIVLPDTVSTCPFGADVT